MLCFWFILQFGLKTDILSQQCLGKKHFSDNNITFSTNSSEDCMSTDLSYGSKVEATWNSSFLVVKLNQMVWKQLQLEGRTRNS